jgi:hypothetical protein
MGVLNRDLIYAVADILGTKVLYNPDGRKLTAKETREVNLSGLKIDVSCEIVSSLIMDDLVLVMVRSIGNLAMFVAVKEFRNTPVVDLHVLNIAKMDAIAGWLEKHKPFSVNDALRLLDKAVVASFVKLKKNEWSSAA